MDKRFQVFVSSTFADLQDERQEVMQALLELECIPAGMELFPAANEDQWSLIKKVIDDCDYYIVIIAGRYGSIGPEGKSYTEMEYRYATEAGKPVIAFLHREPGQLSANRTESSEAGRAKLAEFRDLVQKKMCRFWDGPADLGSQVSRSLVKLIKTTPAVGWVRADLVPDEGASKEILALRRRIEELQSELDATRTAGPGGTSDLAQGPDEFELTFSFVASTSEWRHDGAAHTATITVDWDDIFGAVSPLMMDEASENDLKKAVSGLAASCAPEILKTQKNFALLNLMHFEVEDDTFQTIKVQLRALGLITKSTRSRSIKDNNTYWTLTPYGDNVMNKLRAIRKSAHTQ